MLYANTGFGLSGGGYQTAKRGTVGRFGLTVGYHHFLIKIDRTVNNEFTILNPPEKVSSYSLLVGMSIPPFHNREEIIVNVKMGVGKGESIKRGRIIAYHLFGEEYELLTNKYSTTVIEIDLEFRFKYVGLYFGGFSETLPKTIVYGGTVGATIGVF